EVRAALYGQDLVLVDARAPDEFSGATIHPGSGRGGHLPGAHNLPWTSLLRDPKDDPRLLPVSELRGRFESQGVTDRGAAIVTYCQTGTRSSVAHFALLQLGFSAEKVLNYEGSWLESSPLGPTAAEDGGSKRRAGHHRRR